MLAESCPDILRDTIKPIGNSRTYEPQTGLTTRCMGTGAQCMNSLVASAEGRHNQQVSGCLVRV